MKRFALDKKVDEIIDRLASYQHEIEAMDALLREEEAKLGLGERPWSRARIGKLRAYPHAAMVYRAISDALRNQARELQATLRVTVVTGTDKCPRFNLVHREPAANHRPSNQEQPK